MAVFSPQEDPLDRSAIKSRQLVTEIYVVDSTNNGFRVSYATINSVTRERFEEIRSRPAVRDSLSKLMEVAPRKFPDMVHLDIYDFADFAKRFDPADIRIHNIFVYGREKENMYIGDNPLIRNPARSIDRRTAQGLLYIRDEDIYFPMQNFEKMFSRTSSGAMAPRPVISPRRLITGRISSLSRSAGSPRSNPSSALASACRAAVRAS